MNPYIFTSHHECNQQHYRNFPTKIEIVRVDGDTTYHVFFDDSFIIADGFMCVSDERLKKDIELFVDTSGVLDLQTTTFRYKNNNERLHVGFIAQDVKKKIPMAILESADGMLSIDQVTLIACLQDQLKKTNNRLTSLMWFTCGTVVISIISIASYQFL